MTYRPKRRGGFAPVNQSKMTAEEYEKLIGQYEHIEHKALQQEIAKEFAAITQTSKARCIATNDFLFPRQPPQLPMEANISKGIIFQRSTPWPTYSIIQRASHMFFYSEFHTNTIKKYLQSINISQIQINIAFQVYELMEQSNKYWGKVNYLRDEYSQRYNSTTRKYALQNAAWPLQIAMTLIDFHLDHIVDIVYKKEIWSTDYDAYCEKKEKEKMKKPVQLDEHEHTNYDSSTTSYFDEYESFEQEENESVENVQEKYVNKVADHMTFEELNAIKNKVKQQGNISLDQLFENIYADIPSDGKKIAFADNFEMDLNDEKTQVESGGVLDKLYGKYPTMDKGLIRQTYEQENENFDSTVFQLDNICKESNAFYEHKQGK